MSSFFNIVWTLAKGGGVKNFYNDFATNYTSAATYSSVYKRLSKRISKELSGQNQIIDLGCGIGIHAAEIAKLMTKSNVTAVDFSKNMLSVAESQFGSIKNLKFIQVDITQLPFADDNFDAAISISVISHLAPNDVEKFFNEVSRVLKAESKVIFIFSLESHKLNPLNLLMSLLTRLGRFTFYAKHTTKDFLIKNLEDIGFETEVIEEWQMIVGKRR